MGSSGEQSNREIFKASVGRRTRHKKEKSNRIHGPGETISIVTRTKQRQNPERNNGWNIVINFHGTFLLVSCDSGCDFLFLFVPFRFVLPLRSPSHFSSTHLIFVCCIEYKIIETDFLLVVLICLRTPMPPRKRCSDESGACASCQHSIHHQY